MMIFLFPLVQLGSPIGPRVSWGLPANQTLSAESLRHRELYADPHRDGCLNLGVGGNLVA